MERPILQQNRHWQEAYPGLIERELLEGIIQKLSLKEIQVLIGIRRSGKSSLFKMIINHLTGTADPAKILYINLDDPYYTEIYKHPEELYRLIDTAEKLSGQKIEFLFLDEIQNLNRWEKYVKSVYDAEQFRKIFLTGSNSSLLKSEFAQLLSGRYVLDQVYPFSFKEIIKERNIRSDIDLLSEKSNILSLVDLMMEYGSYPEVYKTEDRRLKHELLINYYDTIVLKDCITNNRVREIRLFRELAHYIISNVGTLFSYNSIARALDTNDNSVKEFIQIMENAFLIHEIKNFSWSLKQQSRARKKIYAIDNGILANVSFRFSENRGKLFENLVFSELKKAGYEIFFYQNKNECDFIARKNTKITAIQVCYEISAHNREREIAGLHQAMNDFSISDGLIISYDQEEKHNNFKIIPFWKYFASRT